MIIFDKSQLLAAAAKGPSTNNSMVLPINQSSDGAYYFSGSQDIDATLIGSKWTVQNLTYSFPTDGAHYGNAYSDGINNSLDPFNAKQVHAVRAALNLVASYTELTFSEITESAADQAVLRFAQTSSPYVQSAMGIFPSPRPDAGDIWFGETNQPYYTTPAKGNWGWATIMHEIGHTLGLKHGHDDYTHEDLSEYLVTPSSRPGTQALPANHDGQAWSLMTYRSYPGSDLSFKGDKLNEPQTYMQDDIAALQYLYGANFDTNAENTVYSWSPKTGQMFIDGIGQERPTNSKIFLTLWDGNGIDTYDLRSYSTGVTVDLRPGAFSTFSRSQLADVEESSGVVYAPGNIANALLYQGDTRSMIERAIGGKGNDRLIGNGIDNRLSGGAGNDVLSGSSGDDALIGNSGSDRIIGGADEDWLYGGHGADRLSGGPGADRFVFKAVTDSTVSIFGRDTIEDFTRTQRDKIDLSFIDANILRKGDQAFRFIGKQDFHARAGELRYVKDKDGLVVYGDVDGNGLADFAVAVKGTSALHKGDFFL